MNKERMTGISADFWRHDIGVNVIPADTRKKETYEPWKEWQDKPIPQEVHEQWKASGAFDNGIAIIPGKVWHNPDKEGLYLIGIDLDNQRAIEEAAIKGLEDFARHVIVEQHKDDPTKAYVLLYSHKPFPKKTAIRQMLIQQIGFNQAKSLQLKSKD